MRPAATVSWLVALAACIAVGIGLGVANAGDVWLPARIGWGVALAAWLGGLAFGLRAVWLPFAGIGAFGLATFATETLSPSNGDDQRALVVLFLTAIPALFAVPALLGAGMRQLRSHRSADAARRSPAE